MNKAIKIILGIIATGLLIYLWIFNIYMAYQMSGIIAAVLTLIFLPVSYLVWFVIVVINNGVMNAYCLAWIVSFVLSLILTRKKKA